MAQETPGWKVLGEYNTADLVASKLNTEGAGTSASISLNAAGTNFVVWVREDNHPASNKRWKALKRVADQNEIAKIMSENGLGDGDAIVSVDANKTWQLWGYVKPS